MNAVQEIQFSVFQKGRGGMLRTDFTETEAEAINATEPRKLAFKNLRQCADEAASAETALVAETKELSVKTRAFNDLKTEMLGARPKVTFHDLWKSDVKGKGNRQR